MLDPEPFSALENYIRNMISPTAEEWDAFCKILSVKTISKKEMLLKEGQICNFIAFVSKGILREYNFQDDREVTVDFTTANNFVTDYPSFLMQQPSVQYLEALTDVEVVMINKADINFLYDRYKIWERLGRLMAERIFCKVEVKRKDIIRKSPEELYRDFVKQYPDIIQQVPQYYIASYVGLSPEHLSRIRKKI